MKKIKLITGLSALSALTIGTLPLTSCNNSFDGKVTEQEWKNAFDYLCNSNGDSYWSFSSDDYFALYDGEDVVYFKDIVMCPKGISSTGGTDRHPDQKTYEYFAGPFIYVVNIREGESHYMVHQKSKGTFALLYSLYLTLADYYNDFSFETDGHYHFSGSSQEITSLNTAISFNKNRRIDHLQSSIVISNVNIALDIHFNYSRKEVEWPEKLLEIASWSTFNFSNTIDIDIAATQKHDARDFIFHINPDEGGYNKLTGYKEDGSISSDIFANGATIYKNNIELTDTDFMVIGSAIKFNEPLKSSDDIYIEFLPRYTTGKFTFKLEAI